jgi:hypothetical protein
MLLNGALVNGTTRATSGVALFEILRASKDDRVRIERLYLRTLSRRPTAAETEKWVAFLDKPRSLVRAPGPKTSLVTGLAATQVSPEIAAAPADGDFKELLKHAKTAPDFQAMAKRMRNNADAGLFVKAFETWAAELPFQYLATQGGAGSPREQAFEDVSWALLNCSEFLTNH